MIAASTFYVAAPNKKKILLLANSHNVKAFNKQEKSFKKPFEAGIIIPLTGK